MSPSVQGTPQGGPLSPLLSNVMLHELDKELEKRGHKFCRYADNCNIYVKSRKAGKRTMEGISRWVNYYSPADMLIYCQRTDSWLRRRLRMCQWKQWKNIRTRHDNLVRFGVLKARAWQFANTRKGYWHTANSPILSSTLTNEYYYSLGLISLTPV